MSTAAKNLSERAQRRFDAFVNAANKQVPHPLDDERFYAFIRVCHLDQVTASETDISRALIQAGFDEDMAESLGSHYYTGRGVPNRSRSRTWTVANRRPARAALLFSEL